MCSMYQLLLSVWVISEQRLAVCAAQEREREIKREMNSVIEESSNCKLAGSVIVDKRHLKTFVKII